MSNFITGKDLLTRLDILPFELFDHVKKGLQPFDQFGRPVPPPDIATKVKRLKELEIEREQILSVFPKISSFEDLEKAFKRNMGSIIMQERYAPRVEYVSNEIDTLKKDLAKIANKYSWINYELPEDSKSATWVLNSLLRSLFDSQVIAELIDIKTQEHNNKESVLKAETITDSTANYFKRSGDFWTIQFEGNQSKPIKHVDGLLYMAYLLERPGNPISCRDLYQSASGSTLTGATMDKNTAIDEGLNIGGSRQVVNDEKAKQIYAKKYRELQNSLNSAESNLERLEIEKDMEDLLPYLKEKTFAKPDDKKAQANIKKRLDVAYGVILKADMASLEKHFRHNIKKDDAYGLQYGGTVSWEIIIE